MALLDLITKVDLEQFKQELFVELKALHQKNAVAGVGKKWVKGIEVRKMLGISPGTLQNLRVRGTLRYTKVGGSMFYKLSDIDAMLEGRKGG
ncbi:helix-turn-helix domain-containing protein [Pedobacter fastidiosus]|uniref:Helix-turn-helix domain-containing protein n=1 Tax=Pedobacter fastidiosus TaxID=2765361 RepID=A0ABR7KRR6_9SPHI|nr:helix-turn-helix domain-containing protein [Pedobacter fastidiosus]MBC6110698.1 helix-turn-helix domain-containing protein [Pedobacter fastidiosus]